MAFLLPGMVTTTMLEDLARSGLTAEDAKCLSYEEITAEEAEALGFAKRPAYKLPYLDINGKPTSFYRLRFLDAAKPRYSQPKGTVPGIYLPPSIDWARLPKDSTVVVVEGEKKSARAAKDGHACLGIGGVWSFRSKRTGEFEILDAFKQLDWQDRRVLIVFDSDVVTKPQVLGALHAFAYALSCLGAKPETVILPEGPNGEKTGLDDHLERGGKLDDSLKIETFAQLKELWKLNEEFAVMLDPAGVLNMETFKIQAKEIFTGLTIADRQTQVVNAKGELSVAPAGPAWVAWKCRRKYKGIDYVPGQPRDLEDGRFNTWKGFGTESVKGDVGYWHRLMDNIFADDGGARHWFTQWVAYPIANPGAKLYQAAVFWGTSGAGKSLTGVVLKGVYGENWVEIDQKKLHGSFNAWAANHQFVLADEISNRDRRTDADFLKSIVTRKTVEINLKYVPQYVLTDCNNFLFTSNSADAMFLDGDDRRYFVHHITRKLDQDLGPEIAAWSATPEGAGALRYYLENYDLTGFRPTGFAPVTEAKEKMIEASRSDLDSWACDIIAEPNGVLSLGGSAEVADLWSLADLAAIYKQTHDHSPAHKALGNALVKAGVLKTKRTRTKVGQIYLFAVRNTDQWRSADAADISAAYNKSLKSQKFA